MKKLFEEPAIELLKFQIEDVLTKSTGDGWELGEDGDLDIEDI